MLKGERVVVGINRPQIIPKIIPKAARATWRLFYCRKRTRRGARPEGHR
jgi:hypothetical protein